MGLFVGDGFGFAVGLGVAEADGDGVGPGLTSKATGFVLTACVPETSR
jgi:hypothetical protein